MAENGDVIGDALTQFKVKDIEAPIQAETPIIVFLDGINLDRVIAGLKPDDRTKVPDIVVAATRHVVEVFNSTLGYTHADEATLLFRIRDTQRKHLGYYAEMATNVATAFSAAFVHFAHEIAPALFKSGNGKLALPQFSANTYVFPEEDFAARFFLWREMNARKSSVQSVALNHFSRDAIAGKSSLDRKAMLADKGFDYDNLPEAIRRGNFIRSYKAPKQLDPAVLAKIPERNRPTGPVMTLVVDRLENVPPLSVIENLTDFVFRNAEPHVADRPFAATITP